MGFILLDFGLIVSLGKGSFARMNVQGDVQGNVRGETGHSAGVSQSALTIGAPELEHFLNGFMYDRKVFLVDRVLHADPGVGLLRCELDTTRPLLVSDYQKGDESRHPRHVSGADMVMMTVALGSMHAFFFHGCRWKEGWVGFGSRMRDVHFKNLSRIGPPIQMESKELRLRKNSKQLLIELSFEFTQESKLVYRSEQSAMFVRPETV